MLINRIAFILSLSLMFNTYNVYSLTPLKASVVKNDDNKNINNNKLNEFQKQYQKDKTESDRKKAEELERQRLIEEQKYRDLHPHYNSNDLREISGISVQRAYELLQGTTYQTWENAQTFCNAEKLQPSVNALFLIGLCNLESYYGKSKLARENNNVTSWRLDNGGWGVFSSKTECINDTIQLISNQYLNPNGIYYKGVTISQVGFYYCEGNTWANQVGNKVNELLNKK